jgi:hypothetical protein
MLTSHSNPRRRTRTRDRGRRDGFLALPMTGRSLGPAAGRRPSSRNRARMPGEVRPAALPPGGYRMRARFSRARSPRGSTDSNLRNEKRHLAGCPVPLGARVRPHALLY